MYQREMRSKRYGKHHDTERFTSSGLLLSGFSDQKLRFRSSGLHSQSSRAGGSGQALSYRSAAEALGRELPSLCHYSPCLLRFEQGPRDGTAAEAQLGRLCGPLAKVPWK